MTTCLSEYILDIVDEFVLQQGLVDLHGLSQGQGQLFSPPAHLSRLVGELVV